MPSVQTFTDSTSLHPHDCLLPTSTPAPGGGGSSGGGSSGGASSGGGTSASVTAARLTSHRSLVDARAALRKTFGTGLLHLHVSCRIAARTRATCAAHWTKHSASYRGHVFLRSIVTSRNLKRWQYRIDVTKKLHGRTQHITHSYRTGGAA